jgi:hypothetical protein
MTRAKDISKVITGTTVTDLTVGSSEPDLIIQDTDGTNQLMKIQQVGGASMIKTRSGSNDGEFYITGEVTGTNKMKISTSGQAYLYGTLDVVGKITADAGIDIDNITIDGTTIALSTGDLTLDVAADIKLDAAGGDIKFLSGGTEFGEFRNIGSDLVLISSVNDKDIVFKGQDGGSEITALTLDMSGAGAATFNNDVTAFSDKRLKTDIQPITDGLSKVMQMQGVYYKRNDVEDAREQIGVLAQDMEAIMPEVVLTADDEMQTKSVDYGKLCAVLIESIKELKAEIDELKRA